MITYGASGVAVSYYLAAYLLMTLLSFLVLIVVGIGLTAPPIGLNVFVISSLARNVPITATYRGVLPFIAADVIRLALCVAFPSLSLWLVRALN